MVSVKRWMWRWSHGDLHCYHSGCVKWRFPLAAISIAVTEQWGGRSARAPCLASAGQSPVWCCWILEWRDLQYCTASKSGSGYRCILYTQLSSRWGGRVGRREGKTPSIALAPPFAGPTYGQCTVSPVRWKEGNVILGNIFVGLARPCCKQKQGLRI